MTIKTNPCGIQVTKPESFHDLVKNVQLWAEAKGIYESSTALDQLVGALGEVGELRDAIVKKLPKHEQEKELGDILVFLINAVTMVDLPEHFLEENEYQPDLVGLSVSDVIYSIYNALSMFGPNMKGNEEGLVYAVVCIQNAAAMIESTPRDCLKAAWEKIRSRTGKMQRGKFIKDE